jgi:hypothetical protein
MESGVSVKANDSAAPSSHSTVVPFSPAPAPSFCTRVMAKLYQKPQRRDLEAGPGFECEEKEIDIGEQNRQRSEDLV